MRLFQYAVILHPTEKQKKDGKQSELVVDLTTILAADDKAAMIHAARAIPDEYMDKAERLEVALRPF